jgi:transposase
MIDASMIRAHQHAAGARGGQEQQALGRSCGGFGSKVHAKVDALGLPLAFVLTVGQAHEGPLAATLVGEEISDYLIADRGYDDDAFRRLLRHRGTIPVIPGKKNRKIPIEYDRHVYKERNQVERFFNRIKHYRGIATRYCKTAVMFLGALTLTSILIWLKL